MSNSSRAIFSLAELTLILAVALSAAPPAPAQTTGILTQHNNISRDGQNTTETILTLANVNSTQFGKLFSQLVDGQIYAQPLYVRGVVIPGKGTHNLLIVATEGDSVYAFDADSNTGANSTFLWHASLLDAAHGAAAGATPMQYTDISSCTDMQPQSGISATPVIDATAGIVYVEAKTKENGAFIHRLHALDITTGNEKIAPVRISGSATGTGDGSSGGAVPFDDLHEHARPGLLLLNGIIYIAYASHCDFGPYHGWVFAYDTSLNKKASFNSTPYGGLGGIWMAGAGIAADTSGNLYVGTGNGSFDTNNPSTDYADTILKLSYANNAFTVRDYFTPFNQMTLQGGDTDLGAGGVLLLPDQPGSHPHVLLEAGKEGKIYLVDRDVMTTNNLHYCAGCNSDTEIVQESASGQLVGVVSAPAYWNNTVYYLGRNGPLTAIPLLNGLLDYSHISTSPANFGYHGATPTVSSNGTSNGIVWAIDSSQYGSPGPGPGPAVLHAYNAGSIATELYNSAQAAGNRDRAGNAVKFTVPTVINGKVYVGTSAEVDVYGLIAATVATPVISPASESSTAPIPVTITDSTSGSTIFYTTDGSNPTTSSKRYTGMFTLTSSATVKAFATATGLTTSAIASATYTINSQGSTPISFPAGFTGETSLTLNGSATISGSLLRLTDGGAREASSAFFTSPLNITQFVSDFSFQLTNATGDGFAFVVQGVGPTALGPRGGGLGYGPDNITNPNPSPNPPIGKSVAVKFDLGSNAGEGKNSTGSYTNGASPTMPSIDLTSSGINLHSSDIVNVHVTYNGTTLTWSLTDATTGKSFSTSATVNIPSLVGGNTAFIGFTAGTGFYTATQDILSWTFSTGSGGAKATVQYETEATAVFNASKSSGPTYRVFAWTGFKNGQGTTLDGNAVGQTVTITLSVPQAGVYDVKFATKAHENRGLVQLTVNGAKVGPAADEYSSGDTWKEFDLGTVSLPAGNVAFVFTTTSKNAASGGYTQAFDYIKLTQQ